MQVHSSTRATSDASEHARYELPRFCRIKPDKHFRSDHFRAQPVVFLLRAVGPVDAIRSRELGDLGNPPTKTLMFDLWLDRNVDRLMGCHA